MSTPNARNLRRNQTDAEEKLWTCLRDRQLTGCKFKRQVPRGPYVVDFACLQSRLIVELDGGQHADPVHSAKDRKRTAWLESEGYRVLRFWNHDVLTNMDGVLLTIVQALQQRRPPHPAPRRLAQALANAPQPSPPLGEREGPAKREGEGSFCFPRPSGEREGPTEWEGEGASGEGAMKTQSMPKRRKTTEAEQKLWARLRGRALDGYKFRRQVPLGPFIVDFCCYDERLVIELDGSPHGDEERQARDRERTRWLESRDFRVLRFWNSELLENMEGVLLRILQTLEQR